MKTIRLLPCLLVVFLFSLTACSGDVYVRAYTASGDGQREEELNQTEIFAPDDDLNVVIKLNRRDESAAITARFIDPNDEIVQEVAAEAVKDVGTVVLGVDYEGRADQVNTWISGRYRVEILVNDELVETLYFRVN